MLTVLSVEFIVASGNTDLSTRQSRRRQFFFPYFLTSIIIVRDDHAGYSNEGGEMMAKEGGLGLRMNQ